MRATHLQVDYLSEPIGLGNQRPRFYWNCEKGKKQTAYKIVVFDENEILWETGEVSNDSMAHIGYEGKDLRSRARIKWCVQLRDENGNWGDIAESNFELGLLQPSDWSAMWIAGDYKPKKSTRYPVDCFRKHLTVKKEIAHARAYISALGLYEARINGRRIGDFVLAPGWTDYRKRVQYQTYDITNLLSEENVITVEVADGWYRGSNGAYGQLATYGRQTKLLAQFEITYTDGSGEIIGTDETWEWSNDGPIRFNDMKDGEIVDASMTPSYHGRAKVTSHSVTPTASDNVPIREKEGFIPELIITPSGKKVLDFGQNMAGFLEFRVKAKKGDIIKLRLGEKLEDGEFIQHNMQIVKPVKEWNKLQDIFVMMGKAEKLVGGEMQLTPLQEICYRCSGENDEYKTKFAIFGFRYALVETELEIHPEDFRAIAVYSDMEQTGEFSCSNAKVNQLFSNILWSMKGNFCDVPTDCPTRERLGWTGDAQVFFNSGAYLMNVAPFFKKWLHDMEEGRMKNGVLPAVIPYGGVEMMYNNTGISVGWADAIYLIPYRYYKRYNDINILREYYGMMKTYADFIISQTGHKSKKDAKANPNNDFIYEKGLHLGEWLEPDEFKEDGMDSRKPHPEEATAYFHLTMTCMAEIATMLGNTEDAAVYEKYAKGSKKAYRELVFKDGIPDTDRMGKLVRPLAFDLCDEKEKKQLQERLALAVKNRDYRLSTGFLSTAFLPEVLTEAGDVELAYGLLENTKAPGWLYQVEHGATTVWEDWKGENTLAGTGSQNHYSPGAICMWMFNTILGIRPDGENYFILKPLPGGTLTHAEGAYNSLYGKVQSRWEKTDNGCHYHFEIPANVTAKIYLPSGKCETVTAGKYDYYEEN